MKITRRQLKRIIREELQVLAEQPSIDDGIGDYYKRVEEERKLAYEKFMQALEKYEALPGAIWNSPEKLKMKQEVDVLKRAYHDAGYVGD